MTLAPAASNPGSSIIVVPDAGPLITLAFADALDLLLRPGWRVQIVDMVLHEVTRHATPMSEKIRSWVAQTPIPVLSTQTFRRHLAAQDALGLIHGNAQPGTKARKAKLGEFAIQETMTSLALSAPETKAVFLFEDYKIARASFLLPDNCRKFSTRAWLKFLERNKWIESAADIERAAVVNGRNFSRLRFPADGEA